eukprot:TRINITY_DN16026_c1_g2_i1.p2 TRINITY_DN16026_c1_g2~~TRINITY_DN16026_c1_g2_i1.p2  ORF type:complete len:205 (+),score=32.49 TRINITY_DN16026_c1_g2_i1:85-699(+)
MADKMYSMMIFMAKGVEKPVILSSAVDVSSFSFLQRSSAKQFITFISRTVAGATKPETRQQVVEEENRVYAHARSDGLVGVVITNEVYPERVAFTVCSATLAEFAEKFAGQYNDPSKLSDNCIPWPSLSKTLEKYQKPTEADQILKIQRDLEDIQTIMLQNLDKVLERGDKIGDLVDKSTDLTETSKSFYKTAKKTNKGCCLIM